MMVYLAGIPALANADHQLKISTSQGYQGALKRWVTCSHAGMLETLNTNFTALTISLAGSLVDQLVASRVDMNDKKEKERMLKSPLLWQKNTLYAVAISN